ncbi:MAG: hypothetical protein Ta2E_12090 [Mycoplasmoidaceae bacterium]|nr:MAG: hypothetical protein Ta2E_12090 [Mycoplasmoidaceae bacterium]
MTWQFTFQSFSINYVNIVQNDSSVRIYWIIMLWNNKHFLSKKKKIIVYFDFLKKERGTVVIKSQWKIHPPTCFWEISIEIFISLFSEKIIGLSSQALLPRWFLKLKDRNQTFHELIMNFKEKNGFYHILHRLIPFGWPKIHHSFQDHWRLLHNPPFHYAPKFHQSIPSQRFIGCTSSKLAKEIHFS